MSTPAGVEPNRRVKMSTSADVEPKRRVNDKSRTLFIQHVDKS